MNNREIDTNLCRLRAQELMLQDSHLKLHKRQIETERSHRFCQVQNRYQGSKFLWTKAIE